MKFDISKIKGLINMANSISSPKSMFNKAIGYMSKKNPEMANTIQSMANSGQDPVKAIRKFASEGKINNSNLQTVKNIYKLAGKYGLQQKVPNNVWKDVEDALKNNETNKFNGF